MNQTQHLLVLAVEECFEVAHRCSKAIRFGFDEVQDGQELHNAQRIADELTDLFAVMLMLEVETGHTLLDLDPCSDGVHTKRDKVEKYMKLSRERGLLDD